MCNQILRLRRKERRQWWSHKFNGFGIKYEIGSNIQTGDIVHYNGPFRAAIHGLSVFRFGLRHLLARGERVMADRGYRGDRYVCTPYDANNAQHKRAIAAIGARHETINGRIATFECMKQTWRHSITKHQTCFRACLVVVQLNHENGRPLYRVVGYSDPAVENPLWDYESVNGSPW
jgi:hypothetical protein